MAQQYGGGHNRLAKALALTGVGNLDLETAGTLLNFDYLRSKMGGQEYENQYHQAGARKLGAEADLKGLELDSYKKAPAALLENAALQSGTDVPTLNAYRDALTNPAGSYEPAIGAGPPAPMNEMARGLEATPPLAVQRGLGEYLRAMGSTKPNAADDLARAAEQGALAQRTGLGTDAASRGDTDLVTSLRELTHNPAPESSEKGQLGVIHGLMGDLGMDPKGPEGQKIVKAFLAKLTTHPDTQNRLQQLQLQAAITFPGDDPVSVKKRNDKIWEGLVTELDPLKALFKSVLTQPTPPAPGVPAPASPAAPALRDGEVSKKISEAIMPGAAEVSSGATGGILANQRPPKPTDPGYDYRYDETRHVWQRKKK